MSKHASHGAVATSEHARQLTASELDHVAGGTPNVTVNGGPLIAPGRIVTDNKDPDGAYRWSKR